MSVPPPYQAFPDLSKADYRALKADIRQHGIKVAIVVDENGQVLDGHQRLRACEDLGMADYPTHVVSGLTEAEKVAYGLSLNLLRRQIGPMQWGLAFIKLCEVKGVRLGAGGDRRSTAATASDTVAGLARGLGVGERTARVRMERARRLAAHPDLIQQVDAKQLSERKALLLAARREGRASDDVPWGGERDVAVAKAVERLAALDDLLSDLQSMPLTLLQNAGAVMGRRRSYPAGRSDSTMRPWESRKVYADWLRRDAADIRRVAQATEQLADVLAADELDDRARLAQLWAESRGAGQTPETGA
jgi:ParB-like chromosome segregation protein Spo0J